MLQRSVCELGMSHASGSATSRTIHEEILTKKNLARILKSANLLNFMQDRAEERAQALRRGPGNESARKNLKDFFSLKTEEGVPWTSLQGGERDPLMRTTPLKKEAPEYDPNEMIGELRKIPFFYNHLPLKCFHKWRTNVL